jgi:glycerol-3-phosphate dehydrogenase
VINATGVWAGQIAALAGCDLEIEPSKGTLVAFASRLVNTIVNRCAMPDDGDILVPVGTVCVIGTTSVNVGDPDQYPIEQWEIDKLRQRAADMVPVLAEARMLRAWAGVRPLIKSAPSEADGRAQTRTHMVIDHAEADGIGGFISIVGGKFTTFRLMAEDTMNLACRKLGTVRPCRTAEEPLPGSPERHYFVLGSRLDKLDKGELDSELMCECEAISRAQLTAAIHEGTPHVLSDLRRDLRLGMGPCQGAFCAWRAAAALREEQALTAQDANAALMDFLQARWKGVQPVACEQTARQVALNLRLYRSLLGVDKLPRSGEIEPYPTEKTA